MIQHNSQPIITSQFTSVSVSGAVDPLPVGVNLAGSRDKNSTGGDQRRQGDKAEHCEVHSPLFTGRRSWSCSYQLCNVLWAITKEVISITRDVVYCGQ